MLGPALVHSISISSGTHECQPPTTALCSETLLCREQTWLVALKELRQSGAKTSRKHVTINISADTALVQFMFRQPCWSHSMGIASAISRRQSHSKFPVLLAPQSLHPLLCNDHCVLDAGTMFTGKHAIVEGGKLTGLNPKHKNTCRQLGNAEDQEIEAHQLNIPYQMVGPENIFIQVML